MEITSGLHRIQAAKQLARFESMLAGCEVLPFDSSVALLAGRIDAELKRRGTTINLNDVMIAAIAIGAKVRHEPIELSAPSESAVERPAARASIATTRTNCVVAATRLPSRRKAARPQCAGFGRLMIVLESNVTAPASSSIALSSSPTTKRRRRGRA